MERRGRAEGGGGGRIDVELRGLPLLFASDTLRIRASRGTVVDVEELVKLESKPAPIPVSEDERAKLWLDIAKLDDEIRACDALIRMFDGMAPFVDGNAEKLEPKLAGAALWVDMLQLSSARVEEQQARKRTLEKRRRELDDERRRLDERSAAIPTEIPRVMRGARFSIVDAGADGAVDYAVEYFVAAARWVPTYALHLTSPSTPWSPSAPAASTAGETQGTQARLVVGALVAQASGEDWTGVQLSVSTADLSRETTLPVLSSWRIGRAQPAQHRAFRPLPSDLPALFWGFDRGPRRPAPQPSSTTTPSAPGPASTRDARRDATVEETGRRKLGRAMAKSLPDAMPREGGELTPTDALGVDEPMAAYDGEDDEDTAAEFERERSSEERPSLRSQLELDDAKTAADMPSMDRLERAAIAAKPAAPPAPSSMPMGMAQAMPAKSRGGFGGFGGGGPGGGGGGRGEDSGIVRAPSTELPPRWRTASMRMAGPTEPQRGSLLPLDPLARLAWLLEAHDVDGRGRDELNRAIQALRQAQARLEQSPLPRGTVALHGGHFPSVMTAPSRTDVPGDGTFYRVEVRSERGPATIEHRCVPRESNDVWRVCRIESKGPPLPPGPLSVYEDGAFKVNAKLDPPALAAASTTEKQKAGTLDVNLGVDPDVRVLSRTVHVRQSEKGLMSSTSRVEHDVHIEIRSTRKDPARVVAWDRLPVPADNVKDINVVVTEEKPPLKKTNKDAAGRDVVGAFEWRATVMPGDTQHFVLKYAVDLPAKAELEGGNRRE